MDIAAVDTRRPEQVREFLNVPFHLYRQTRQWVPPILMEARRALDRKRNPYYRHSDAAFFVARRRGEAIGRLAALEKKNYNAFNREHTAFFWLFECARDPEAAGALFDAAFGWARARGPDRGGGPQGVGRGDGAPRRTRLRQQAGQRRGQLQGSPRRP